MKLEAKYSETRTASMFRADVFPCFQVLINILATGGLLFISENAEDLTLNNEIYYSESADTDFNEYCLLF